MAPKGRDEDGLQFSMAWVRHHDKYSESQLIDPMQLYKQPEKVSASCCEEKHG
jgi:hypothetical protein